MAHTYKLIILVESKWTPDGLLDTQEPMRSPASPAGVLPNLWLSVNISVSVCSDCVNEEKTNIRYIPYINIKTIRGRYTEPHVAGESPGSPQVVPGNPQGVQGVPEESLRSL